MVSDDKVQAVQRMLSEGIHSYRTIARVVEVSRETVNSIASGNRPDYAARRRLRAMEMKSYEITGPVTRCPECGGMVEQPCRLCQVRGRQERQRAELRAAQIVAQKIAVRQWLAALLRRQLHLQRECQATSTERRAG